MAEMIMELALAGLREKGRADAQALAEKYAISADDINKTLDDMGW